MAKKQSVVEVVAKTKQYDDSIKKATQLLNDFGKSGPAALAPLLGAWGKLVPAVAAATGGVQTFNKIIGSTQTLTDAYEQKQRQLNSVIDSFFNAIARGDMSGFISNLKEVARYAKEAANALDDLGTFNIFKTGELADIDAERARLTAELKSGSRVVKSQNADGSWTAQLVKMTKDEIEAARRQLEEYDKQRLDIVATGVEKETKAYNDLLRSYISEQGFRGTEEELQGAIDFYIKGYRNYDQAAKRLAELNEEIGRNKEEKFEYATNQYGQPYKRLLGLQNNARADQIQNSEEYRNLTALVELGDKKLEEAMQHRVAAAQLNQEMNRALQKDAKAVASGTGVSAVAGEPELISRELDVPFENMKNAILGANEALAQMGDLLEDIDDIEVFSDEDVEKWNKKQEELRKNTADFTAKWDSLQSSLRQQGINEMASAFETLGDAVGGTAGNIIGLVASMAKQVAQGIQVIANISAQEAALTAEAAAHGVNAAAAGADTAAAAADAAAKSTSAMAATSDASAQALDAGAKAMNAHSWIPFVGVAMGVGMVATIFATLASMPKFAEGGIVGGNSYSGDKILARLNSGEGVLTQDGMKNLAGLVQGGGTAMGGEIKVRIENDELVGTLGNASSRAKYTN